MLSPLCLAPLLFAAAGAAGASTEWQASLADALAQASRDQRPIVVCLNRPGEMVSDELLAVHYRDERIVGLMTETVNLFASDGEHVRPDGACARVPGRTCVEHRAALEAVRKHLADQKGAARSGGKGSKGGKRNREGREGKGKGGKPRKDEREAPEPPLGRTLLAPQHVFLDGQGQLLFSVPYGLTVAELEWCLTEAIAHTDPQFDRVTGERVRPPLRLLEGELTAAPRQPAPLPPDAESLERILKDLHRTGKGDWDRQARDNVASLVLSEDPKAVGYVKSMLSRRNAERKSRYKLTELLHLIGRTAPRSWWTAVAPSIDDYRVEIRTEAAVALEQLAHPGALDDLIRQYRKEDDPAAKAAQLRALAAVAPAHKSVLELIATQARKGRPEALRIEALIAAAALEQHMGVSEIATTALEDASPPVRAMAAWLIGVRRSDELRQVLQAAREAETDTDASHAMDLALAALARAPGTNLEAIARRHAASRIPRDRQ